MTDRSQSSVHGGQTNHPTRNSAEPFPRDGDDGHIPYNGQVDIIALVRSLQRRAGLSDCFRQGRADCDDVHCNWRAYCIGTPANQEKPAKDR